VSSTGRCCARCSRRRRTAEIDIPDKAAALRIRQHIGLLDDERHVVVFNMTPGQSVSIIDVVDRCSSARSRPRAARSSCPAVRAAS
jgi:hypothetical protein